MSQPNCEIVNTSNQTKSPSQRVWEVDFLRGFLILFVIFDHMMFNLWYFCQDASTAMFSWLCSVANAYYNQQTTLGGIAVCHPQRLCDGLCVCCRHQQQSECKQSKKSN